MQFQIPQPSALGLSGALCSGIHGEMHKDGYGSDRVIFSTAVLSLILRTSHISILSVHFVTNVAVDLLLHSHVRIEIDHGGRFATCNGF
jgi:hypothetical protein